MSGHDDLSQLSVAGVNPEGAGVLRTVPKSWRNELIRMFAKIVGRRTEQNLKKIWDNILSAPLKPPPLTNLFIVPSEKSGPCSVGTRWGEILGGSVAAALLRMVSAGYVDVEDKKLALETA